MLHRLTLVTPSYGRSITDDGWEAVEAGILNTLIAAQEICGKRRYEDAGVSIDFDFSKLIDYGRRLEKFHGVVFGKFTVDEKNRAFELIEPKDLSLGISVEMDDNRLAAAENYAETALCDLFLALNLATPAALDLYRAHFSVENGDAYRREVSFSNYLFEAAQLDGDKHWPQPILVELQEVWTWLRAVRQGEKQLPSNRSEKVLFAILHMCKLSTSPELVVWIFYALETLLDTKIGENFRAIVERTAIVLDASEDQKTQIKKGLRLIYDIRSAFVHGGLDVIHPLNNEMLDKNVEAKYSVLLDSCDFGFRLVFCLVQQLILRKLPEMRFVETLEI